MPTREGQICSSLAFFVALCLPFPVESRSRATTVARNAFSQSWSEVDYVGDVGSSYRCVVLVRAADFWCSPAGVHLFGPLQTGPAHRSLLQVSLSPSPGIILPWRFLFHSTLMCLLCSTARNDFSNLRIDHCPKCVCDPELAETMLNILSSMLTQPESIRKLPDKWG
jgi:hypothetical protein